MLPPSSSSHEVAEGTAVLPRLSDLAPGALTGSSSRARLVRGSEIEVVVAGRVRRVEDDRRVGTGVVRDGGDPEPRKERAPVGETSERELPTHDGSRRQRIEGLGDGAPRRGDDQQKAGDAEPGRNPGQGRGHSQGRGDRRLGKEVREGPTGAFYDLAPLTLCSKI
jgi:hypothetical protein